MDTRARTLPYQDKYRKEMGRRIVRFKRVWLLIILLFIVLAGRLAYLQLIMGGSLQKKAMLQHTPATLSYNDGRILDRNGMILAQDSAQYDIYAHRRYFYKETPQTVAAQLAPILNISEAALIKKLQEPYDTISIKKNVSKPMAMAVRALQLPCLDTPKRFIRKYPQGHLASHILGYVNQDATISTGVENTARQTLREAPGLSAPEINAHGDFINPHLVQSNLLAWTPKARDVHLTIDSRIQYVAESALEKGLRLNNAQRGSVIVMDPKTGELLAFAVSPSYDPEKFASTPQSVLKNWAITDVYPPGSTFKILTVACGLESGAITEAFKLNDTGFKVMNGFKIMNYDYSKRGAPGLIDLVYLLQHSSNVGSLTISLMIPPKTHYKLLKQFGIGQKTGIDIPGESAGIIHPPHRWTTLDHATIGYGYYVSSTPIQIASAVSAIANNGVWVTPHLLKNATNVTRRRVLSAETAHTVTRILAKSIEAAKENSTVYLDGYEVAGKTGTSRKPSADGRGYSSDLFTSFVGYFPASHPKVLVMVVVDSPRKGNAWGSTVAGPIFHEVATQAAQYLAIQPDKPRTATKPQTP